ncbi:putative ACR protein [Salinisphaera shabanensis E1L3A]|uniref:Protein nucleotidyltransferase YdiU n=1 Tax=Salinisphaera shabanensis E1L3A TaxID=1033802 RepID=U2E6P0_9GAMM|nr:YdiU family protein [Salinisphaera shabanensis]ERJ19426.1 putative ACR protein [Salinisphaera shabanensis E1L3A]
MTETATAEPFTLDNTYARLPGEFYAHAAPTAVAAPRLLRLNRPLADQLGLDAQALEGSAGVEILSGNRVPKGAEPLAMAYAGHQFGNFSPTLGDGRAVLLGEITDRNGARRDIQLKGAGPTPFSSRGDGRAALGPVIREYVVSEGMAGLGIPTTRALAMVATGESVFRMGAEPGGVLTRVAASHVRVGTFEYFSRRGNKDAVRALADYVIERHYPNVADAENPYQALLEEVAERTADLIAQWLLVGFIHGVMNTDNVSIAGETIDYGPCAFMDAYNPATVYSSIDRGGRYAYNQQPGIGQWNLARFAEGLLPILDEDETQAVAQAQAVLERYIKRFETTYYDGLAAKIGLQERREGDADLAYELLECMTEQGADFTLTFRHLADLGQDSDERDDAVRTLFDDSAGFDRWAERWRQRLAADTRDDAARRAAMRAVNPAYIPRNHRIQQAIDAAEAGDYQPLDELLTVVAKPFDDHPELTGYARPPKPEEVVERTFCGT